MQREELKSLFKQRWKEQGDGVTCSQCMVLMLEKKEERYKEKKKGVAES